MEYSVHHLFIASVILSVTSLSYGETRNGFDISQALIPSQEIHHGGPTKDGIPALDTPSFVTASNAGFLQDKDPVLGIMRKGISKAYPIKIMNWHEVVNDVFDDEHITVTFCPLCGTGMAFTAQQDGQTLHFGVSGLLYNNDVLLYDRATQSLWSQLLTQAISGPLKGEKLSPIVIEHTRWAHWRQTHPNTLVLSDNTGFSRDYQRNPYVDYDNSPTIYFPVSAQSEQFPAKERVLGLTLNGQYKAYPFSELSHGNEKIIDNFAGQKITVHFNKKAQSAKVFDNQGQALPSTTSFWFAWYAFHPETKIYQQR